MLGADWSCGFFWRSSGLCLSLGDLCAFLNDVRALMLGELLPQEVSGQLLSPEELLNLLCVLVDEDSRHMLTL